MQGTALHDQAELKQSAALNILLTEQKFVDVLSSNYVGTIIY